tara:strand:- start:95 stop:313 length:219 start_codon:yes stop_codon:yes gene_type:complete
MNIYMAAFLRLARQEEMAAAVAVDFTIIQIKPVAVIIEKIRQQVQLILEVAVAVERQGVVDTIREPQEDREL